MICSYFPKLSNYIGEEFDLSEAQLDRLLSDSAVRLTDGALVVVDDAVKTLRCRVLISHETGKVGYSVSGNPPSTYEPLALEEEEKQKEDYNSKVNGDSLTGSKRQYADLVDLAIEEDHQNLKRSKLDVSHDVDVIE